MTKWCFNYESGEYEDIDKDGYSWSRGEYVYNWDDSEYRREEEEEKNVGEAKTRMTMIDLFFVYCGAMIDIGTDISVPMEMIGIVAKNGTIRKGLDKPPIQS